jgi:nucleoside-diphosphate-sugar epimerase
MYKAFTDPLILVTGATGFLGSAVVRQLQKQSRKLRTSARRKRGLTDLPDYHAVDLSDRAALARLVENVEVIIHTAGVTHDPTAPPPRDEDFFTLNTKGTESLIRTAASARCRRFVLVSSISVYGRQKSPITERSPCCPMSSYARSKLAAEQLATQIAQESGMELAILRMAPICGEGARGNLDRLMKAIDRRCFVWVGNGKNKKSLIYVEDAAAACVVAACCNHFPGNGQFNVSAEACTMREIVNSMANALERTIPPLRLPGQISCRVIGSTARLPLLSPMAQRIYLSLDKWLSDEVYDSTLFRTLFNWCARIDVREALFRQVQFYRASLARCA